MEKNHGKKMIAPIIITVLFVGYLAAYIYLLFFAAAMTKPILFLLAVPLAGLGERDGLYTGKKNSGN